MVKEISQSLSINQQEWKVLRHSSPAEGGECFAAGGAGVGGVAWGDIVNNPMPRDGRTGERRMT